jgi:formylglycine-generating enzyme
MRPAAPLEGRARRPGSGRIATFAAVAAPRLVIPLGMALGAATAQPCSEPLDPAGGPADASACPPDMVLVEGLACTDVLQTCAEWMEPPHIAGDGRCARFEPSRCVGPRVPMRFCIDRDEHPGGDDGLPANRVSFSGARRACEADAKRLCLESEWNFACEGEAALPYPTGLERDSVHCNFDRMDLLDEAGHLRDLRKPAAEVAGCSSPFGARSMVGNVDEWVSRDVTPGPHAGALKGGWWLAGRNRCRPATTQHDDDYADIQTGFRCCAPAASDGQHEGSARRHSADALEARGMTNHAARSGVP